MDDLMEPVADEDREPDPQEPEDADEARLVGEDPRIAEAEWERDHGWRFQ